VRGESRCKGTISVREETLGRM
jgi:hypothetical protein